MQWGQSVEQLENVALKTNKIPQALAEQPEVFDDMLPYWEAYGDMMHSRQIGMTVGPIALSEIVAYLTLFPGLRADLLVKLVRELDQVYLEHHSRKNKLKKNTPPARTVRQPKVPYGHRRA